MSTFLLSDCTHAHIDTRSVEIWEAALQILKNNRVTLLRFLVFMMPDDRVNQNCRLRRISYTFTLVHIYLPLNCRIVNVCTVWMLHNQQHARVSCHDIKIQNSFANFDVMWVPNTDVSVVRGVSEFPPAAVCCTSVHLAYLLDTVHGAWCTVDCMVHGTYSLRPRSISSSRWCEA